MAKAASCAKLRCAGGKFVRPNRVFRLFVCILPNFPIVPAYFSKYYHPKID